MLISDNSRVRKSYFLNKLLFKPNSIAAHFACPTNWHKNGGQCYKIFDDADDWITARSKCKQYPGADLAVIRSKDAQDFVNRKYSLFPRL